VLLHDKLQSFFSRSSRLTRGLWSDIKTSPPIVFGEFAEFAESG
jgi:hypothetical protein